MRPVDNTCRNCTVTGRIVRKLTFEFNLQAAPPNTPTEATICPCCDILWSNLDVSPLRLRTITTATRAHNNANLRGQSSGYNHTLQQYQQYQQQTYQPQTYRPQPQQNYQQSPYLHQQLQQQVQPRSYQSSQGLPPSLPQGEQLPLYNQPNYQQHQQQQQYQTGQPSGQPSGQLDPRMEGW